MWNKIWSIPKDKEILQAIKSQKARTEKQVRKKALQVRSSKIEEEGDEEEEPKVQVPTQKTITVGEK